MHFPAGTIFYPLCELRGATNASHSETHQFHLDIALLCPLPTEKGKGPNGIKKYAGSF
jgi:hypothetical protein